MNDRERLIEIMAKATIAWRWGTQSSLAEPWFKHDKEMFAAALAAAEAAGFVIVPPDDATK